MMKGAISKKILVGSFFAFFVNGIAALMTGAVLPYLIEEYHFSYSLSGTILALQAVGFIVSGIVCDVISLRIGRKLTLILGALCFFAGYAGILLITSPVGVTTLIFITGIGWGIFNTILNAVISEESGGKASVINILHMFFAAGAFSAPFMISILLQFQLSWKISVVILSVLSLALIPFFGAMPLQRTAFSKPQAAVSFSFLRNGHYLLFMGIIFFYAATENGINGWLVTFLLNGGRMDDIGAHNVLTVFWVSIIFGRLMCSYLSRVLPPQTIVLLLSSTGLVLITLFLLIPIPWLSYLLAFLLGASLSGILPTTIANASFLVQESALAGGVLLSCAGLGGASANYIIGLFAQGVGISSSMLCLLVSAAILVLLVIMNVTRFRKRSQ